MQVNDQLSQHTQTGKMPDTVGKLGPDDFMKYVAETRAQPAFRTQQDKAADYYDGNQLSAEILGELDRMGFSQLMTNLIKPAIDAVLGIEAKSRTDFRVAADDDEHQEVAEALSAKLAEAERESRADRACSDAYAGQAKAGLGWVHVARNSDPFQYAYKAESVHRREMFWDWSTPVSDTALEQARYVIRQKWFPVDQVTAAMPQHAPLINASASGWQPDWMQRARESTTLMNAFDQESRMSISAWDWRNIDNRRVALQECWYATYIRGLVLNLGTRVVEFDKKNPLHMAAVGSGKFRPEPAVYRKLRCSIWFGPHLLQDSDPGTNKLPYVPFWGFREDLTGVPYGLIRSMMPLQDEVNARRRKLMWLLSSKRVTADADALDARYNDFSQLVDEVSRPDSMVVTNPSRIRDNAIKVESDLGLSTQQFEILNEAKQGIQDAAGIFNSMMGKTDGAHSGIAINSLVEQSSNTLGELNDNFKFSRQLVGERLLELIRQDLSGRPVQVMAGPNEAKRKVISLNTPQVDELTGVEWKKNDVDKASVKVALEDVPSTPAYRAQQQQQIGDTIKSLPPIAQGAMIPYFIESGDLPKRHEIAATLRKVLGLPDPGQDQEDPQVAQLKQALEQAGQSAQQMASHYEQAVQEQAQKAQTAEGQVSGLQVQLKNKDSEIQLRGRELELKGMELQQAAQDRQQALQVKAHEQTVQSDQTDLARQKLAIEASARASEHAHRTAELDHTRQTSGQAAQQAQAALEHQQLTAAQQASTEAPAEDEGQEIGQVKELIDAAVTPLSEKLDQLISAIQQQAEEGEGEAEPAPIQPAASPASKPKKRSVVIKRDAEGRMIGADLIDADEDDGLAPQRLNKN